MVNNRRPITNVPPMPRVVRNAMNIPYNALAHAANAALSVDTAKEWAAYYVGKSPQFAYDVVTNMPNVLAEGYRGMKGQMTGATPLVTGEPGRPHTDADTYQAAKQSIDALGAAGLFTAAAPARAAALGARTRPASAFTAYHGSPHDFDKFKMSQIGTGEGAQSYGHGLYFAEAEDVAKNYRDELSSGRMADSSKFDRSNPNHVASSYVDDYGRDRSALEIDKMRERLRTAIARDGEDPASTSRRQGELNVLDRAKKVLESGDRLPATTSGHLYEVNIKANKDDFLDWDKVLGEQSKSVQDAWKKADIGMPVEDLQFHGAETLKSAEISKKMKEAGIPGIKYKDAGSRGKDGGTYNYVIFDDSLIEIAKKNGIAVKQTELGTEISERGMQMLAGLQAGEQLPQQWSDNE